MIICDVLIVYEGKSLLFILLHPSFVHAFPIISTAMLVMIQPSEKHNY